MINVTKTYLPSLERYQTYVKRAFDNSWLTNRGELVQELEEKLKNYLEVNDILVMNNGTIPIQIALKLLADKGEVITTPFSYVATTSSILWENCTPVFVDIHPEYLTLDETKIEEKITHKTTCILATHVFGNPCHVEEIERIAKKHNLAVIYDAAHSFATTYKGKSVFEYGDISTCSFHATKLFHTAEGGALFTNNKELMHKAFYSHNFGHKGREEFQGVGINGKISEINAAMGLAVFEDINQIISERKKVVDFYKEQLKNLPLQPIRLREGCEWNYAYYPIIFNSEDELLQVKEALNAKDIFPRRYFYPSLNTLNHLTEKQAMPVSESISKRILCLPLYVGLEEKELNTITQIIQNELL